MTRSWGFRCSAVQCDWRSSPKPSDTPFGINSDPRVRELDKFSWDPYEKRLMRGWVNVGEDVLRHIAKTKPTSPRRDVVDVEESLAADFGSTIRQVQTRSVYEQASDLFRRGQMANSFASMAKNVVDNRRAQFQFSRRPNN